MTLTEICGLTDIPLPQGWPATVEGAALKTPATQMITFGQRTVLTIVVLPYGSLPGQDSDPGGDDAGDDEEHPHADDDSGEGWDANHPIHISEDSASVEDRSRSPRREGETGEDQHLMDAVVLLPLISADDEDSSMTATTPSPLRTILDQAKDFFPFDIFAETVSQLKDASKRAYKEPIILAELLGPRIFDLEQGMLPGQGDHAAIFELQTPWKGFSPLMLLEGLPILDCTKEALCGGDRVTIAPTGMAVWTAKNGRSGWSIAIVMQNPHIQRYVFHGVFGTPIDDDHAAQTFHATPGDSFQAEQVAVIWSILWLLQSIKGCGVPLEACVYFDYKAAGDGI